MSAKSTSEQYGVVAIAFHWITAILIIALVALGMNAANAQSDDLRRALIMPHIALGILVLVLTLARIVWWWFFDRRPAPVAGVPPFFARLARLSHLLIYGFIIAVAASGIATNIAGGVIDALSSGAPIPDLDDVPPRQGHGLLAWSFVALLVLHVTAALYHHFIRRDATLARMVGKTI